jgi:hypothetical protein
MSARRDRPDLNTFMEAYALLGVEYGANPLDIRKAFTQQARAHHPDRFPPESPEQQHATQRMAAINVAYQLIRDAPLRHHRVSTGARPDDPWTNDELEDALRRSRRDVVRSRWGVPAVLSALGVAFYLLVTFGLFGLLAPVTGSSNVLVVGVFGFVAIWVAYFFAAGTPAGLYAWRIIDVFRLLRFVVRELNHFR